MQRFWFLLYNGVVIPGFWLLLQLGALVNPKIRRGIRGRRGLMDRLEAEVKQLKGTRQILVSLILHG